jgi:hypothetical protein
MILINANICMVDTNWLINEKVLRVVTSIDLQRRE